MNQATVTTEKPKCTTGGSLHGGRAMCGKVIVGGVYCGAGRGECELQEGFEKPAKKKARPASRKSAK